MQTIRRGDKGNTVRFCQERLVAKGFHISIDGDFGKGTEAAVKQFQASEQLGVDGIVGSQTWARLQSDGHVEPPSDVLGEQRQWLIDQIPADAHPSARAALLIACKSLGCKEIPSGSNSGAEIWPFVGGYNEYWQIGDTVMRPWCVMFVASSIAISMGLPANPKWGQWPGHPWYKAGSKGGAFRGSSSDVEAWGKSAGTWTTAKASSPAAAGAYFTMARGSSGSDAASSASAGHTGFVVCDNGDGTVTTCEGNVSNKVGANTRRKTSLRGWATWWSTWW